MSKFAATFSGKTGDILWSLATVRELSRRVGQPLDFYIMPMYESLLPLLASQSYIAHASSLSQWGKMYTGSPCGDQPWHAPVDDGCYQQIWHLTYRYHPTLPLIRHTAEVTVGIQFERSPVPFIETLPMDFGWTDRAVFAYAFNEMMVGEKQEFLGWLTTELSSRVGGRVVALNLSERSWLTAASMLRQVKFFLGCRSANYVLAHGVGCRVLIYEPNTARRPDTFGCPYGQEVMPEIADREAFLRTALEWMK